jgi:histidine triad (HIT) family protein
MSEPTLFEKILNGDIPSDMLHEDKHCGAFRDIAPQAPVHILIVPRRPLTGIDAMDADDRDLIGHLFWVATEVARSEGLDDGYRLVINNGELGLQSVPHLHLHLLGKRQMAWPPG